MSLTQQARELAPEIIRFRHELHQEPEVGLDLPRTQEKVLAELAGLPLEITLGTGCTSVTAVLRGGAAAGDGATGRHAAPPCCCGRTWTRCRSRSRPASPSPPGMDGAMHACGHDLHTSMLAGAARLLARAAAPAPRRRRLHVPARRGGL